ncbi:MAG: hypothetical protein QM723_31555 [Myxococcaceae bacterium]
MLIGAALCVVLTQSPLQPSHVHLVDQAFTLADPAAEQPALERGSVWWTVLGVTDGVLYVGTLAFVIAGAAVKWRADGGYAAVLTGSTFVGAAAGGFGGYFLGEKARDGSFGGRVALIVLAAAVVTAGLVTAVYGVASLASSGLGFTPN